MADRTFMTAMQLSARGGPLQMVRRPIPDVAAGELLLEVLACGICRTDLHILDGDVPSELPVVPGHEIVGRVLAVGKGVRHFSPGERVGVPWLGGTCGHCFYCRHDRENLCDYPVFTGCSRDGGFASHCVADAAYCLALPDALGDVEAAPLLCAGLIGFRSYRAAGEGELLGFYGFGAAAHILAQLAIEDGRRVFAFTRPGDIAGQEFARSLGCEWAGGSDGTPPALLDAGIIFAPVGALVPIALRHLRKGGRLVCAGIHMSDIPAFPYDELWGERSICSVANLTRRDGADFMSRMAMSAVRPHAIALPLIEANKAMQMVRDGEIEGAAVLIP